MWQALVAKNSHRAASGNMARILVLPWVVIAVVELVLSLGASNSSLNFFIGLWFVVGIVIDIIFATSAMSRLMTDFRQAAAQRYLPRRSLFKRLFSGGDHARDTLPPVIVPQNQGE
jgi:hypothetical protein